MGENIPLDSSCLRFRDRRSTISINENKSTYRLENDLKLKAGCYHVDGCLIKEGERCDFLLTLDELNACVLIELKGKDVEKAISQIKTTYLSFRRIMDSAFFGRIVTSATYGPVMDSNEVKRVKLLLKSSHGNLKIKSSPLEEKTSTLGKVPE